MSEVDHLLAFVRGRDVPCPRCGYNLRDMTEARCPECAESLRLSVGLDTPRFAWLVVTMAPGIFSGVCSVLLAIPLIAFIRYANTANGPPLVMYFVELFGIMSCLTAITLYQRRARFLAWSVRRQRAIAIAAWVIHISAFVVLLLLMR